jgi:PAS domain S-box-containing protein
MTKSHRPAASAAFSGMPAVSTFSWDSSADRIVLSKGAQTLLGVPSPISTNEFFGRVYSDDRVRFAAETAAHLEKGAESTREFRFIRPDGTVRHLIVHATLAQSRGTDQTPIRGIFIDVTPAREAGKTAIRARASDTERAGGQQFGSYEFDVRSGTSVWSGPLREMFMRPSAFPVTAEDIHRSVHPDDRDGVTARMRAALHAPGPYELSFRVVLPDGSILRVRDNGVAHADPASGKVVRVTGVLTDITRDEGESGARKLANETFWRLIDTAPVGVYAVGSDLRMARINRSGLPAFAGIDNLMGRPIDEVLHILWPEPFASDAVARFRHTLATGEPHHAEPVIEDRADRKVLEAYDWSIERIVMDDGQSGVLCYFYDLTERVRSQRALERQQRRLSLAYDAAKLGAWEIDLRSGKAKGTPQLSALFGEPGFAGDVNEMWRRVIHPEDQIAVNAAFAASVKEGTPFEIDFRIVTAQGDTRYLAARGEPMFDEAGRLTRIIGVDQDVTDRKLTEIALRDSEGRMRTIINNTLAFVGVLDPDGALREVNQPALDFGGLTREELLGKPFWEVFWWTHDADVAQQCHTAVMEGQAGRTARFDVVIRGAGDQLITIDFLLAPVFDDKGDVQMLVASGFDISAREDARAREKALMGEINHRTKNILTLVQAVARQTARGGTVDFIARFEERLNALAKAQDLLFHSTADRVDLRALAGSQLDHFRDLLDNRIVLSGPPVDLAPHAAQAIGMALHELATNAGKYGALSAETGRVDVVWDLCTDIGTFQIRWVEQDGPPVDPPQSRGFGSTVIDQMTRSVLNADVDLDYARDGVTWQMTCAITSLTLLS